MSQVDVKINGKAYRIACEDGQENRLTDLARMVDGHVADLVEQVGQVGDTRLLVMASLMVADELVDLRDAADLDDGNEEEDEFDPNELENTAIAIENLADRIEGIAERLEAS